MVSNYKEVFLSEARDQLDNLNYGLIAMEKEPDKKEHVHQVFRACHTLKGNSAMMGYNDISELSHKMENVLGAIRDEKINVDKEIIDTLFDCIDTLEEGLDNIEKGNKENIDIGELIETLESFYSSGSSTASKKTEIPARINLDDNLKSKIKENESNGLKVFRVIILFNKDSPFKGPKTQILMKKAGHLIKDVIFSRPDFNDIKEGKIDDAIDLLIATSEEKEKVEKEFNSISELNARVLGVEEDFLDKSQKKPKDSEEKSNDFKKGIIKNITKSIQSIKVDVKQLDNLVNLVGELLISNMRLKQISKELANPGLNEVINNIEMLINDIQEEIMQQRMVPVGNIFNRYPRLVRDLANKTAKDVELIIEGQDIKLDRNILDEINEPLIHIIRNSVDHGIESKDRRINKGKPEKGRVKLIAKREKNTAIIIVEDDGKGIDIEKVKKKVVEKGFATESDIEKMSDVKIYDFLFRPGFSTNDKITEISGRGVGMDVVKSKIKRLNGSVKIESSKDKGTRMILQLPLTLAIISSLLVNVKEDKYAIPLSNVIETIDVNKEDIRTIKGNEVILVRGEEVPLIRLSEFFYHSREEKQKYSVIVTEDSEKKVGLVVDNILNQQPILIKNLHPLISGIKGLAGATILGDGRVCLIADVISIAY